MDEVELLIVGAGPAGISLAVEARCAGIAADKIIVLEKSGEHSWSIRALYPDTKLVTANWKGIDAQCEGVMCLVDTSKGETLTYLDRAIAENDIRVHYHEEVFAVEVLDPPGTGFVVRTSKTTVRAKVVVIAIGIFGRPNKPDYALPRTLKGRVLFDVTSVSMKGEDILVVGGGDSASEYCQYLSGEGNRVTMSYRKSEFGRMLDLNRQSLLALEERGQVRVWRSSNIVEVADEGGKPKITFADGGPAPCVFDRVVYALGGSTPQNFLKSIGVKFEGDEPVLGAGYQTVVPGLFLAGDLTGGKKGGSIITAFNASHHAMRHICENYLECKVTSRTGS
jgi:thioredoxin reductase (NADPH)